MRHGLVRRPRITSGMGRAGCGSMGGIKDNAEQTTHPVGEKRPNAFGVYDMHGNASEWVAGWYGAYPSGPVTEPRGPLTGDGRVARGGSWLHFGVRYCRAVYRSSYRPDDRNFSRGFRLAIAP